MTSLVTLWLDHDGLSGPLPAQLSSLVHLTSLAVNNNPGMCGTPLVSVGAQGTSYSTLGAHLTLSLSM